MPRVLTIKFSALTAAAFIGFALLFRGVIFNFWLQMTLTVLILCVLVWAVYPSEFKQIFAWPPHSILPDIIIGLASAAVLYGIFWAGKIISEAWFGFAQPNIAAVYDFKGQTPVWLIGLLMGGIIGPGEEILWRGWMQNHLEKHLGLLGMGISVLAYAGVHAASLNVMLILAAGVCGAFWGALYHFRRSLLTNIISHIAWDLTVFLWLPFNT
jgi:membrane protease YdiL (CAAX protease family)